MSRVIAVVTVLLLLSAVGAVAVGLFGPDPTPDQAASDSDWTTVNETTGVSNLTANGSDEFEWEGTWVEVTLELQCYVPWCETEPNESLTLTLQTPDAATGGWETARVAAVAPDRPASMWLERSTRYRLLLRPPTEGEPPRVVGEFVPAEEAADDRRVVVLIND